MDENAPKATVANIIKCGFSMEENLDMISQILLCCRDKPVSCFEFFKMWGDRYELISGLQDGWKAIWKPLSDLIADIDFPIALLVEVRRVNCHHLCACVRVADMSLGITGEQHAMLIDLYPVYQDFFHITCIAEYLSNLRFFFSCVLLPWDADEEVGAGENWVNDCLKPRIELFRDMLANKIPPLLVRRIKNCLCQCRKLYEKLRKLREDLRVQKNLGKETLCASSEAEKLLLLEMVHVETEFKDKRNEIQLLENAVYRSSLIEKYKPNNVEIPENSFHVVSLEASYENFVQQMERLKSNIPKNGFVLNYVSLDEALAACKKNNIVCVLPGTYTLQYPLKCGTIKGLSDSSEVTLISKSKLSVSGNATGCENLTIKFADDWGCLIETERFSLKSCVLIGKANGICLSVLPGCTLELVDCEIQHCSIGIVVYPSAVLCLRRCVIKDCGVGIKVEGSISFEDVKYENCAKDFINY